jgi:hypothetical protein
MKPHVMTSGIDTDWIDYGGTWWDFHQTEKLAQPGVQIEIRGCLYLIGDINTSGGLGAHWRIWGNQDVVIRYRQVWAPPPALDA